jgi:hypothetical protein
MKTIFKSSPFRVSLLALVATSVFGGVMANESFAAFPASLGTTNNTSVDKVDELATEVRALLVARDHDAARAKIAELVEADGLSRRSKVWELRGQMTSGLLNDILKEIDKMSRDKQGADTNYLYGMAFAIKADQALASGITDGTVSTFLLDAQNFLEQALEYDGPRFDDAYVILAKVARGNFDLDAAIAAGTKAVEYYPKDPVARIALGTAQLDRYSQISNDEARKEELVQLGNDMLANLQLGAETLPVEKDRTRASEFARGWKKLAEAQLWLKDSRGAGVSYGEAMAWDPTQVDFGQLWTSLGDGFIASLDLGKKAFQRRYGKDSQSDALLLWWLGYARFYNGNADMNAIAQEELLESVRKWPSYANSYYYVMHLRYASGDMDGAADIMLEFWKANPTAAVATVSNDLAVSLPIIEWLVKYCYSDRKLDGAILAELLANADLPGDAHWSDRALFLRDHADILIRNDRKMADDEEVHEFYEESLRAYERALEIAPKNPNYMNDLAVVLDYNLKRDLQRALALYDEANVIAKALMDDPETSQDDKDKFYSVALLDSGNNAKRLRRILEKREGKKGK